MRNRRKRSCTRIRQNAWTLGTSNRALCGATPIHSYSHQRTRDGCVHVDVLAAIQGKNVGRCVILNSHFLNFLIFLHACSTSIVVDVDGRHVKTQNGSVYMLGTLDANISSVLERVGFKIDQDNPLTVDSAEPLLYAERVVYGKAGQLANQAVSILYELQSVLEEPRTNGTFDSIFECLQTIGFDVTPKKPSRE